MNCMNLKAGDKVWIERLSAGQRVREWGAVERTTRTQVLVNSFQGWRFKKLDSRAIGDFTAEIVGVATEEEIASFELSKAAKAAKQKILDEELRVLRLLFGRWRLGVEVGSSVCLG